MNDLRKKLIALILTLALVAAFAPTPGFVYAEEQGTEATEMSSEATVAEESESDQPADQVNDIHATESAGQSADSDKQTVSQPAENAGAAEGSAEETPAADDIVLDASEEEITETIEAKLEKVNPQDDAEAEELFEGYLKMKANGSRAKKTAGNRLMGTNKVIYDYLKTEGNKVAAGKREYTVFKFTAEELLGDNNSWTAADLGVKSLTGDDGKVTDAVKKKIQSSSLVLNALLADNPYGMYWFDKTRLTRTKGLDLYLVKGKGEDRIEAKGEGYYMLPVVKEYSQSKITGTYYFDTGVGQSVTSVVSKSQAIVDKYAGLEDRDIMTGYADEICRLVSYNYSAAASVDDYYGDPWQLIWVFDGDPSTNVVCEGYAKAFKFLCDITDFNGSDCIIVTGTMRGSGHMWNVVTLDDGFNYMVDVTNSDGGSGLASTGVFMCDAPYSGSYPSYGFLRYRTQIEYAYDDDCMNIFSKSELLIPGEAGKHRLSKVEAVAATCTTAGNCEYYVCDTCGRLFADAEGGKEITENQTVVKATGHHIVKTSTAATCEHTGLKSHYECTHCHKMYTSAAGTKELASKQKKKLVIKKKAHSYKKKVVSDKYLKSKATCTKKATYYYSCKCGRKGKKTFTAGKALGHSYAVTVKPATVKNNGSIVKQCTRCKKKAKTTKIYKASKVSIAKKYQTVAYKGGNAETTTVTVKNSRNKTISKSYYDLSFDNNYETGVGTVTVTFKGNYSGTKTLTYKIKGIPAQTEQAS